MEQTRKQRRQAAKRAGSKRSPLKKGQLLAIGLAAAVGVLVIVLIVSSRMLGGGAMVTIGGSNEDGGEKITRQQVEAWAMATAMESGLDPATLDADTKAQLCVGAITELVDLADLRQRAETAGEEALSEDTQRGLRAQATEKYESNAQTYDMGAAGVTEDVFYEQLVRAQLIMQFREEVLAANPVTDAEIQDYYDTVKDSYTFTDRAVRSSHILIGDSTHADEDRELAEQIRQRAADGEDFAALAKEYSQDATTAENGGDIGFSDANSGLVESYYEAMMALEKGEVSQVVETDFGFHIILATDVKESGTVRSLDEVRGEIEGILQNARVNGALRALRVDGSVVWGSSVDIDPATGLPSAQNFTE